MRQSVALETPEGVVAHLLWDPATTEHDRRRLLAREVVAARQGLDAEALEVVREQPSRFGYHTQLVVSFEEKELPLTIATASFRGATVVAAADPDTVIGIDLRDAHPDETTWQEIRQHSHLWPGSTEAAYLTHWRAAQAVLAADGRGARVRADEVVLDTGLARGWIIDRPARYRIVDASGGGFLVMLAYGARVE